MLLSTRIQILFALAVGGVLGYVAAAGHISPLALAEVSPPASTAPFASTPPTLSANSKLPLQPEACCIQAADREMLMADASLEIAQAQAKNAKSNNAKAADSKKPNIVFIMADDVGWFNIGAYHQGIMAGRTPNLDKLAAQGMRFTDY